MGRPRLLSLFCGAGGDSVGYARAGFEVVGVDIAPQPNYPFEFHQADALDVLKAHADYGLWPWFDPFGTESADGFDVIHASPPCKRFTVARKVSANRFPSLFDPHPDLLTPTLERLARCGMPWVVENVPGAPVPDPVVLCGSMFGLRVRRHRLFASNVPMPQPKCRHGEQGPVVGVYGTGGADSGRAGRGGGGGVKVARAEAAEALGVDWTTHQPALSQMIPPAYTQWIGERLLDHLRAVA